MTEDWQYVIMFNSYPEEVMPLGTTEVQANDRAIAFKKEYLERNKTVSPGYVYVFATRVRVHQSP